MSKQNQKHIIRKFNLNLNLEGDISSEEVQALHRLLVQSIKENIGVQLERLLNQVIDPEISYVINRLDLKIPNLEVTQLRDLQAWRKILEKLISKAIREQVLIQIQPQIKKSTARKITKKGPWDVFTYFIKEGYYPAWASSKEKNASQLLAQLVENPNTNWKQLKELLIHTKGIDAIKRIVFQLDDKQVRQVVFYMFGKEAQSSFRIREQLVKKFYQKHKGQLGQKRIYQSASVAFIQYWVSLFQKKKKFHEKDFSSFIWQELHQQLTKKSEFENRVETQSEQVSSSIEFLEYFLENGSVPIWASRFSAQEIKDLFLKISQSHLYGFWKILERNKENTTFFTRLYFQIGTELLFLLFENLPSTQKKWIEFTVRTLDQVSNDVSISNKPILKIIQAQMEQAQFSPSFVIQKLLEDNGDEKQSLHKIILWYELIQKEKNSPEKNQVLRLLHELYGRIIDLYEKERISDALGSAVEKPLDSIDNETKMSIQELLQLKKAEQEDQKLDEKLTEILRKSVGTTIDNDTKMSIQELLQLKKAEQEDQKLDEKWTEILRKSVGTTIEIPWAELQVLLKKRIKQKRALETPSFQALMEALEEKYKDLSIQFEEFKKKQKTEKSSSEKKKISLQFNQIDKIRKTILTGKPTDSFEKEELIKNEKSIQDLLIFYLQYGSLPWWANDFKEKELTQIIEKLLRVQPDKFKNLVFKLRHISEIWKRLSIQLPETLLTELCIRLFPDFGGMIPNLLLLFRELQKSQILKNLSQGQFDSSIWPILLESAFHNNKAPGFVKQSILLFSKSFQELPSDILRYLFNLASHHEAFQINLFTDLIDSIRKDEDIPRMDEEIKQIKILQSLNEKDIIYSESDLLKWFDQFIQTGKIPHTLVQNEIDFQKSINLWTRDLMEKQAEWVEQLILQSQKPESVINALVQYLDDFNFNQILILTFKNKAVLASKYEKDMQQILPNKWWKNVRIVLWKSLERHKENWKPIFLIEDWLQMYQQGTNRKEEAILQEWKAFIYENQSRIKTNLLHQLIGLELESLKQKVQRESDPLTQKNMETNIRYLESEWQILGQNQMFKILWEQQQVQSESNFSGLDWFESMSNLEKKQKELKNEIAALQEADFLKKIALERNLIQLEAEIEIAEASKPMDLQVWEYKQKEWEKEWQELERDELPGFKRKKISLPSSDDPFDLWFSKEKRSELKQMIQLETKSEKWEEVEQYLTATDQGFLFTAPTSSTTEQLIDDFMQASDQRIRKKLEKSLLLRFYLDLQKELENRQKIYDEISKSNQIHQFNELSKSVIIDELRVQDQMRKWLVLENSDFLGSEIKEFKRKINDYYNLLRIEIDTQKERWLEAEQIKKQEKLRAIREKIEAIKSLIEKKRAAVHQKLHKKRKPKEEKPIEKPIEDSLMVPNAGLVILHPFIGRLFQSLGYVEKNKFVSEEKQIRAALLLQYLVNGKKEHPENELVLNKIMCGIPLNTPLPLFVDFTEAELQTADSLLSGSIQNWERMKTMTVDALRGTFLIREGQIKEDTDRWKLKVERGSFDILLKTLPWAFTFVRYGWMPKFIMVDWPLPGS